MSRNAIVSPHFEQRGLLITSTNTAYPQIGKCTIGRALRKSYVLKVTDVWKSDGRLRSNHERVLEYEICAMFAMGRNRIACPRFGFILTNLGVF
jgi:hypothetical protein